MYIEEDTLLLAIMFTSFMGIVATYAPYIARKIREGCKHKRIASVKYKSEDGKILYKNTCKDCGYTWDHEPIHRKRKSHTKKASKKKA